MKSSDADTLECLLRKADLSQQHHITLLAQKCAWYFLRHGLRDRKACVASLPLRTAVVAARMQNLLHHPQFQRIAYALLNERAGDAGYTYTCVLSTVGKERLVDVVFHTQYSPYEKKKKDHGLSSCDDFGE